MCKPTLECARAVRVDIECEGYTQELKASASEFDQTNARVHTVKLASLTSLALAHVKLPLVCTVHAFIVCGGDTCAVSFLHMQPPPLVELGRHKLVGRGELILLFQRTLELRVCLLCVELGSGED